MRINKIELGRCKMSVGKNNVRIDVEYSVQKKEEKIEEEYPSSLVSSNSHD